MTELDPYEVIKSYYAETFRQYGPTPKGLAWQNQESMDTRFQVMLDLIKDKDKKSSLLDFGCGTAGLLDFLNKKNIKNIEYIGLDANKSLIDFCKKTYNNQFIHANILKDKIPNFDYIIINGVFTVKEKLLWDEMWNYFSKVIKILFEKANIGIAFNLMSEFVDWKREDLFHVPLNVVALFATKELTRHYVIRNDYKLYEFTTYVYK